MISKIIFLQLTLNPPRWSCTIDIPNPTIGPTQNEKSTAYYKALGSGKQVSKFNLKYHPLV